MYRYRLDLGIGILTGSRSLEQNLCRIQDRFIIVITYQPPTRCDCLECEAEGHHRRVVAV